MALYRCLGGETEKPYTLEEVFNIPVFGDNLDASYNGVHRIVLDVRKYNRLVFFRNATVYNDGGSNVYCTVEICNCNSTGGYLSSITSFSSTTSKQDTIINISSYDYIYIRLRDISSGSHSYDYRFACAPSFMLYAVTESGKTLNQYDPVRIWDFMWQYTYNPTKIGIDIVGGIDVIDIDTVGGINILKDYFTAWSAESVVASLSAGLTDERVTIPEGAKTVGLRVGSTGKGVRNVRFYRKVYS